MSHPHSRDDAFDLLLEEHKQLRALLGELGQMLAHRSDPIQTVTAKLQQLNDQIDTHFHAEEASDCFPELVTNSPRVSDRVTLLLGEHGELRVAIHEILQEARQCTGTDEDWTRLVSGFEQFAARLMAHERTENELVQEVFTDDIGSKD